MSSKNNETRNCILDAAWKLLEAGQGQGVRMSDIAKQVGISRQAVYLHFSKRSELLIATTRYIDEVKDVDSRLKLSRNAASGVARLDAYIDAWSDYIPEIYGVACALLSMKDTDEAAAMAWDDRMQAFRKGCEAAIEALNKEGGLSNEHSVQQATDILWTLLSVKNWEQFTLDCGWSQEKYKATSKLLAHQLFVNDKISR